MNTPIPNRTSLAAALTLASLLAASLPALAQTDIQKLEQENQDLKKRLDAMEDAMKKEGLQPSGDSMSQGVKAMEGMTISGFITSSYFYDIANSKDKAPSAYLWNTHLNSFTLNKAKLNIAGAPIDKDKWSASYKLSLLFGQDAAIDDTGGYKGGLSTVYGPIREAYMDLNVPIGTGLDIRVGEFTSLLNYESGDGGAANDNFSQGYQWYWTGNPPAEGVQLAYSFTDKLSLKLRLQNGLFTGPVDTGSKTFMGGLYFAPDDKTSLAFIGFAGRQNIPTTWYNDGFSFIGSRQLTGPDKDNLNFATEFDYFNYSIVAGGFYPASKADNDFWSVGGWLTGDITAKSTWALRADFVCDDTGFATLYQSPDPSGTGFGPGVFPGHGQDLSSVTLTLNWKPAPNVKIQPEVRWNHSTVDTALNGKSDQFIVGCGASYLF